MRGGVHAFAFVACAAVATTCDVGATGRSSRIAEPATAFVDDSFAEVGTTPDPPRCGDGRLDPTEQCDDGNTIARDGCSMACQSELITHRSPAGVTESCQLLVPFPFTPPDLAVGGAPDGWSWYRHKDIEAVEALCAVDLYESPADATKAVGVCPKIHKTFPGLEIYDLDDTGLSKANFERDRCGLYREQRGATKVAKLKASVFGRESESGLVYFHFARLLGNGAIVYPSTYRTIAIEELGRWSDDALAARIMSRRNPRPAWSRLRHLIGFTGEPLSARLQRMSTHVVVHGSPLLAFASLAENPRGEIAHDAFNFLMEERIAMPFEFRQTRYFQLVMSRKSVAAHLGLDSARPDEYREHLQTLSYARDFTHVLMLDHLFHQRDRSGNIHQQTYFHYTNEHGHMRWKKKQPDSASGQTIPLARVILKDNDEALNWDQRPPFEHLTMIDDFRHIDPIAYHRVQWLAGLMLEPAADATLRHYFVDSVHIADVTYTALRQRLLSLADVLRTRFDRGELRLDLDPAAALRGELRDKKTARLR